MENNQELIRQCEEKARQWLSPSFDEATRKEVQAMLDNEDKTDLIDAFYQNLEFGTGGLRGIMGAGTNEHMRSSILLVWPHRASPTISIRHSPVCNPQWSWVTTAATTVECLLRL